MGEGPHGQLAAGCMLMVLGFLTPGGGSQEGAVACSLWRGAVACGLAPCRQVTSVALGHLAPTCIMRLLAAVTTLRSIGLCLTWRWARFHSHPGWAGGLSAWWASGSGYVGHVVWASVSAWDL